MKHTCHAKNCKTTCPPIYLMCGRHWRMVPRQLQRDVWNTYREGQCDGRLMPSREWHVAADATIDFVFNIENKNGSKEQREESKMKTQDHVAAHVNGLKSSLHAVEVQLTILKQLIGGKATETEAPDTDADDVDADDADFGGKAAKTKGKAAASSFDDDDGAADDTDTDDAPEAKPAKGKKAAAFGDEDEADEKPAKAKKAPKLTIDDVNDACKERCGRTNRAEVLGLLKKNFKVKSVTDLEPADYEKCIKVLKGK